MLAGLSPISTTSSCHVGEPFDGRLGALRPLLGVGGILGVGVGDDDEVGLVLLDPGDRPVAVGRAGVVQHWSRYVDLGDRTAALGEHDQAPAALQGDLLERLEPLDGVRIAVEEDGPPAVGGAVLAWLQLGVGADVHTTVHVGR